ncbi:MAG: hypothetical protein ACKORK_00915, partial [Gemmatimonadota bacterium]
ESGSSPKPAVRLVPMMSTRGTAATPDATPPVARADATMVDSTGTDALDAGFCSEPPHALIITPTTTTVVIRPLHTLRIDARHP